MKTEYKKKKTSFLNEGVGVVIWHGPMSNETIRDLETERKKKTEAKRQSRVRVMHLQISYTWTVNALDINDNVNGWMPHLHNLTLWVGVDMSLIIIIIVIDATILK